VRKTFSEENILCQPPKIWRDVVNSRFSLNFLTPLDNSHHSDDWKAVASSTIVNWIARIEDLGYELYVTSSNSAQRVTFNDILTKFSVKGNRQVSEEDQFDVIKAVLKIGRVISDAIDSKKQKEEDERKALLVKAASKREVIEMSTKAGKKDLTIKKEKYCTKEVEEDDAEEDMEDADSEEVNEDVHKKKKRRHRRSGKRKERVTRYEDSDDEEEHEHGLIKDISTFFNKGTNKINDDPGMTLAIESAKARQEEQKTRQMELTLQLAQVNSSSSSSSAPK
jgi:hypothetical protein